MNETDISYSTFTKRFTKLELYNSIVMSDRMSNKRNVLKREHRMQLVELSCCYVW